MENYSSLVSDAVFQFPDAQGCQDQSFGPRNGTNGRQRWLFLSSRQRCLPTLRLTAHFAFGSPERWFAEIDSYVHY